MLDRLYIVIPMAIHQISYQSARSLWQILRILLDDLVVVDRVEQNHLLAIRRELKSFDIFRGLGYLFAVRAVSVHRPYLSTRKEGDLAIQPSRIRLTLRTSGQCGVACTVGIDDGNLLLALIGLHTIVAHLIDNLLAVGTGLSSSDTAHSPKSLRGHQVAC